MSSYFMLRTLNAKRRKAKHLARVQALIEMNTIQDHMSIKKCRICLSDGSIPIFSESSADMSKAVQLFAGIDISRQDSYPKYLCNACHSLLQGAILLRKSAQKTEKILKQIPIENYQGIDSFVSSVSSHTSTLEEQDETQNTFKDCKTNLKDSNKFITHKNLKQSKNVRIQCPICHRLLTAQLYQRHLARHQSASHLVCDVCGKLYRKDNLVRHLQLHNFDLPFQCPKCPYRGRFTESLKIHMRTHTGQKPFSCEKCELRFLTRSNLNRHLLTHKKERPFKCIECGRGFYTKRDMDVHFKSDHTGVKDFGCRVCGNKYGTRKALMRHELRVHKRDKMAKGRMPLYLQAEYRTNCDS